MTASSALPSPRRRFAQFRRWTKRALLGSVVILLLFAIAGTLYQCLEVRLWAKASPPGRLVRANGASMHIYCTGEGTPTVVLVSGLGDDWTTWGSVLQDVAAMTRVCAYDRAGLGWSAASPAARTSRNIAAELEATLNAAGEKGPYILVGHSIGGLHIREYQAQHPDKVAGMLFLDSAYPGQTKRFPPEFLAAIEQRRRLRILVWLSYLAEPRLSGFCTSLAPNYPAQFRDAALATGKRSCDATMLRAVVAEMDGFEESQDEVSNDSKSLGSSAVTVISSDPDKLYIDGLSPEITRKAAGVWAEMQMELTKLSSRSQHLLAQGSTHYVQTDRPDLVISSIHDLVERCRSITGVISP
jgi:pimeloyl-ACP methyl ester carboxylesterase